MIDVRDNKCRCGLPTCNTRMVGVARPKSIACVDNPAPFGLTGLDALRIRYDGLRS